MANNSQAQNSRGRKLTCAELRAHLHYDPETGVFVRLRDGKVAGGPWRIRGLTYRKIWVLGYQHLAHRLAWLYVHGKWPDNEIDHRNGDGTDNRLKNLRDATRGQNSTNSPAQKHSKTGLRDVHFHPKAGKYRAQICKNLKITHLGYFETAEEAHRAYLAAAAVLHGEFVRVP